MTATLDSTMAASTSGGPVYAADRTANEKQNVDVVLEMFGPGWGANKGWEDVWRKNTAPNFVSYFHAFPPTEGVEAAIEFNRDLFVGFPDLVARVDHVTAEGDSVVIRGNLQGRHTGAFLGVPGSDAEINVPDVTLFRLKDGQIVEMRYFTDLLTTMTAMGAIPSE